MEDNHTTKTTTMKDKDQEDLITQRDLLSAWVASIEDLIKRSVGLRLCTVSITKVD